MKRILLLTVCLVFVFTVGTVLASAPPIDTCQCDKISVIAKGNVLWFCCLFADGSASVKVVGMTGKVYASGKTKADGTFYVTGSVKAQKCHGRDQCCIVTDTIHVETSSCVCVVGNKGKSGGQSIIVLSPCQKSVAFKFGTICEDFFPCKDC